MYSPLQLMTLQVETLYRCDVDGRLRSINEPEPSPAPRFFMGRTSEGNVWRTRYDLPAELVQTLDALCRSEPVTSDFTCEPVNREAIKQVLDAHEPITSEWRGPAYYFSRPVPFPSSVMRVAEADDDLVQPWFTGMQEVLAGWWPCVVALEKGHTISICFSSRLAPQSAEAGVETLEAFRGQGYAAAVVAGWAAEVQRSGRIALYSTSWDNLASQGVARRLGLVHYGEDWSLA